MEMGREVGEGIQGVKRKTHQKAGVSSTGFRLKK